jgi:hypothetical protein
VPTGANQDGIGGADPTAGYNGPNVLGYVLTGDYAANLNATRWAKTPAINCTGYTGVTQLQALVGRRGLLGQRLPGSLQ